MQNDIFGYSWSDIQRAQQGGRLSRPIVRKESPSVTDQDRALLAQHGADGLRALQYFGTLDRLQRAGLI